jgi:hypothetical protein
VRIGLAWYEERDYPAILEMMEDAYCLPVTFASWREKAYRSELALKGQRHDVVRAMISPGKFPAWCQSRGLRLNANARKLFAGGGGPVAHP